MCIVSTSAVRTSFCAILIFVMSLLFVSIDTFGDDALSVFTITYDVDDLDFIES